MPSLSLSENHPGETESFNPLTREGVPFADVAGLGWSKVATVVRHLTAENASDLLDVAKTMNRGALQEHVRSLSGKPSKLKTAKAPALPFGLTPEQVAKIAEALTAIRATVPGLKSDADALTTVVVRVSTMTPATVKNIARPSFLAKLIGSEPAITEPEKLAA